MDLLFKRYADPFSFINGMILAGRFCAFVDDFIQTINREIEDQNKEKEMQWHWELWLHRILDQSFSDYLDGIKTTQDNQQMSARTVETTINESMKILQKLSPEKGGEA